MDPTTITKPATGVQSIVDYLLAVGPRALLLIATVVGGVVASRLARRATVWLVERTGLDALAERVGVAKLLYAAGIKRNIQTVLGQAIYWIGLLLTGSMVAEMLGLPIVAEGIATLTSYIPKLFATAVILIAGLVAADVLRSIVSRVASRRKDVDAPDFVGQAVYYVVVVISGTIAADHLGFKTELINSLIQIALGAGAFGLALAFALGAGGTFRHIVARYYAERIYRRGDLIEVDGKAGVVMGFGAAQVIIDTKEGEYVVPCQHLMDAVVRLERVERKEAEASMKAAEEAEGRAEGDEPGPVRPPPGEVDS